MHDFKSMVKIVLLMYHAEAIDFCPIVSVRLSEDWR